VLGSISSSVANAFCVFSSKTPGEPSTAIRERVAAAREIQRERFAKSGKTRCNSRMSAKLLKHHCALDEAAEGMMKMAMTELNFSARAYDRILKVARTIADLANSENILAEHIGEAIQYRTLDRIFGHERRARPLKL
jgi:magnesium chelatase family protein